MQMIECSKFRAHGMYITILCTRRDTFSTDKIASEQ